MTIQELESQFTSGVYTKRPIALVRGHGARVWDSDENEYVDCVGGQGSVNVGHANPAVAEAIAKQAQTLITCPEMFYNDRRAELEQKLTSITGMPRVFLCNSGTEAVEAAIKFARLATKRTGIVAAMRGFHGRTFGALSATWEKKYREPFEPLVPDFSHISYNDVAALDEAVDHKTAAVLLEVVQGEGGVRPGTASSCCKAQEMCRDRGALLILDEVQTGFGRTGKMFAFQHYGLATRSVVPGQIDGGRLADGRDADRCADWAHCRRRCTARRSAAIRWRARRLSRRSISSRAHHLADRAAELGAWFMDQLKQIESPLIREVRGLGLMVGIELKQKVTPYLQELMKHGVLALPAGLTTLRFLPPLVVEQSDLARVVEAVRRS